MQIVVKHTKITKGSKVYSLQIYLELAVFKKRLLTFWFSE